MAKPGSACFSLALIGAAMLAAPADAIKDFSPKGATPVSNVSVYGTSRTTDNAPSVAKLARGAARSRSTASMPQPANWLMMVAGFGLLGAMNRRSESNRLRDEMVL